jgi:hypothetical protein
MNNTESGKSFLIPAFFVETILSTITIADFYTLFALGLTFFDNHKRKKLTKFTIKIIDIARLTNQNESSTKTRKSIHNSLARLKAEKLIDYLYIPVKDLGKVDLKAPLSYLEHFYPNQKPSGNHRAIVCEFLTHPLVEHKKLEKHREDNTYPLSIPRNLCTTVKAMIQRLGNNRNTLQLHKLSLWAITRTKKTVLTPGIPKLNQLIGFNPLTSKCSKADNINLVSKLLDQLVHFKLIEGYENPGMSKHTLWVIKFATESSRAESENINARERVVIKDSFAPEEGKVKGKVNQIIRVRLTS